MKTKWFQIRISPELKRKLAQDSKARGLSMTDYVCELIEGAGVGWRNDEKPNRVLSFNGQTSVSKTEVPSSTLGEPAKGAGKGFEESLHDSDPGSTPGSSIKGSSIDDIPIKYTKAAQLRWRKIKRT